MCGDFLQVQDSQETIHMQRVKFQASSREKQQQLLQNRDKLRSLKQKVAFLEKENSQLSNFLSNEQQQAERGRGLISRLEEMVQKLSASGVAAISGEKDSANGEGTLTVWQEKEDKLRGMVSLLQKEKSELEEDKQLLLKELAEAEIKHADETEAATAEHKATEMRLLNHITKLRAKITKLKEGSADGGFDGSGAPPTDDDESDAETAPPPPPARSGPGQDAHNGSFGPHGVLKVVALYDGGTWSWLAKAGDNALCLCDLRRVRTDFD